MISFMLHVVPLYVVVIGAIAGLALGMLKHVIWGSCCKNSGCCQKECKPGYEQKQGCCPPGPEARHEKHNHHHGDMVGMLWHKIGWFVIYFAQAYGLAYVLENFDVLGNLKDAIALALFVAFVFVISSCFAKVVKCRSSFVHFVIKSIFKLVVYAVMAWIIVYFAGMAVA